MKQSIVLVLTGAVGLLTAGCATSLGTRAQESDTFKTQLGSLESQMGTLNQRIEEIANKQATLEVQLSGGPTTSPERAPAKRAATPLSNRDIQLALKSAGFYAGSIDGKLGPKTLEALRSFQRFNHLTPDGKVGMKTSAALAKRLENHQESQETTQP